MNIPQYTSGTIHHALARLARRRPRHAALLWDGEVFTWEDLFLQTLAMTEALVDAGVRPGSTVAVWGTSAPFHVISLCAAGMVEAVQMPLNPRWQRAFLREVSSRASVLITDGRLEVPRVVRAGKILSWSSRERATPRSGGPWPSSAAENSPVTVDFTRGGATAFPRGAVLTHAMVLGNASGTAQVLGLGGDDSVACLFPAWQHPHELVGKGLVTGCTTVAVDFPYPRTILALLYRHSPTWVIASPRVLEGVLPFGDRVTEALGGVSGVVLVGDYAKPRLISRLAAAGLRLMNAWGSAETSGIALMGPITPDTLDVCGLPCPGYEASLRSNGGGREGELLLRGEAVSLAYFDKQPARGPEGWFATGDLARLTADGGLRLAGRPGEAVLREGRPISLVRLENALARVPGVADSAAIITETEPSLPTIYVEHGEGPLSVTSMVERLRRFFRSDLPQIHILTALPRMPDGRIDKSALASGRFPSMGIDAIDKALLGLINTRASSIASTSRSDETPLSADEAVLQRMVGSNTGPLFDDSVREIFTCIIDHCRRT
ncbi:AMP-binding protein [Candidatus Fermentibacteria bacterium]|nr:AMP-binding protein [Candidatus Fermentibacteria bacterium]